jgi:hypothetical protein
LTGETTATLVTFEELNGLSPGLNLKKDNLIVIKSAFQAGRTSNAVALRALARLACKLSGWEIFLISPSLEDWRNLLGTSGGSTLNIKVSQGFLKKEEFSSLLKRAKFFISLNYSDGVSNSFLECCAAHTYPVLSTSACVIDWGADAALQLDPYDTVAAERLLEDLFTFRMDEVDALVKRNFESLRRYAVGNIEKSVCLIFNSKVRD